MNAAVFLVALVLGFIGGVAGALVAIETKTEQNRRELDDIVHGLEYVRGEVRKLKDQDNALALAIQTLTQRIKTDRAGIWESLNGLWQDYDEWHQPKPQPKPKAKAKEEPKTDPEEPEQKERKKAKK